MKEVVVATYNKDYSWIKNLNKDVKKTIYRKGVNHYNHEIYMEKNIGREIHTYFYHFVKNYANLADYTFTSQDHNIDHVSNYIEIINGDENLWNIEAQIVLSGCWFFNSTYPLLMCDINGYPHSNDLDMKSTWDLLFVRECPNVFRFSAACHFCITKEHAQKRPIYFYKKILNILENNPMSPWIIERLMAYIFDLNYEIKID
jgi:hypothetical protein